MCVSVRSSGTSAAGEGELKGGVRGRRRRGEKRKTMSKRK